jgi:hypothetical protein
MKVVAQNNDEPPTHLCLRLIRCCAAKASSSCSSMCICDRESRSLELSFSAILHRERANKVFGSDIHDCSLASSSSSPRLVYLFVDRTPRVIAFNANFIRPIAVLVRSSSLRNRKSRMVTALKSCLIYFIC